MTRASWHTVGLTLLLALFVSACTNGDVPDQTVSPSAEPTTPTASPSAEPTGPRPGGVLRFALATNPESIDPRFVADDEGTIVVDALFDSLVALDDDLEVVPSVADSWEISPDATTLTFTLDDDASFHDGTPVTAEDFRRSFSRMVDARQEPRSFLAYLLAPVIGFQETRASGEPLAGVEAVDPSTLVIRLQYPFAEFLEVLTHPSLAPVPPSADTDLESYGRQPIGNGPFAMAGEWELGEFIRVVRNDDYSGEDALLDEVLFRIYVEDPAQDQQFADFEADQLQVAEVPADQMDQAAAEHGRSPDGRTGPGLLDGDALTIYYYGFNNELPPFDDADVRRAFSELINRDRIAQEVLYGTRRPADSIVPPGLPGYQAGVCTYCVFAPQEAVDRLATIEDLELPESITLLHNTGETHSAIASIIADDIEANLDIEVDVQSLELRPFVQTLQTGQVEMFRLGWPADYPSMGAFLYPLFHTSNIGTDNLARYSNPDVDALLDQARAELDPAVRRDLYQQAEQLILEDAAIAPVVTYRHRRIVAEEVRDFVLSPLGRVDLARVWLDT